ncbi:MAG TPA: carbohydrate kinase family protein [Jatrophihabitans sp.]|nr:carbohydrate kinase family protein [Jatrophihabitans sp.]
MAGSIVCVGDVMQDVLVQLAEPLVPDSDTEATVTFSPGGAGANTACWLGWLGSQVSFAGRVGDDCPGREALAALQRFGVRPLLTVDRRLPTGSCIVLIGPDGERSMIPSAGANDALTPADLAGLLTGADHLHLSGYTLLHEASRAAGQAVLAQAVAAGCGISVDVGSAAPIRAVGAQRLLDWLPAGTLLLANVEELAALTGERPDRATELVAAGHVLVVKDGPRGARLIDADGSRLVPTEPVPAPDSTGAGDAFAAGLLAARLAGQGWVEAIRAGNRTGAVAVSQLGAQPPEAQPAG